MKKKAGKWFGAIAIFCLLLEAGIGKTEAGDAPITKIELHFVDEVKEGELSWPKEVYGPENAVYEVIDVEEINMEEED